MFSGGYRLTECLAFSPTLFPYHAKCSFYARWTLFRLKEEKSDFLDFISGLALTWSLI